MSSSTCYTQELVYTRLGRTAASQVRKVAPPFCSGAIPSPSVAGVEHAAVVGHRSVVLRGGEERLEGRGLGFAGRAGQPRGGGELPDLEAAVAAGADHAVEGGVELGDERRLGLEPVGVDHLVELGGAEQAQGGGLGGLSGVGVGLHSSLLWLSGWPEPY